MCETEKAWLEESTCVKGELTERERESAERAHSDSWRHLTNGKIQIAATVMYIERREPDEPRHIYCSSVSILIPSGFCSL